MGNTKNKCKSAIVLAVLILLVYMSSIGYWKPKSGEGDAWSVSVNELEMPAVAFYASSGAPIDTIEAAGVFEVSRSMTLNDANTDTMRYYRRLHPYFRGIKTFRIELTTEDAVVTTNDCVKLQVRAKVVGQGATYNSGSFTTKTASKALSATDWTYDYLDVKGFDGVFSAADSNKVLILEVVEGDTTFEIAGKAHIRAVEPIGEGLK